MDEKRRRADAAGDIRARVRSHLERLRRAAALAGAAATLGSCPSPGDGGGPVVCDPLPPPLECDRPATYLTARAAFREADGGRVLVLTVEATDPMSRVELKAASAEGATVLAANQGGARRLVVELAPEASAQTVVVSVALDCQGQPAGAREVRLAIHLAGVDGAAGPTVDVLP